MCGCLDLAPNPGTCPDLESNWQPFDCQPALNLLSYTTQGGSFIFNFLRTSLLSSINTAPIYIPTNHVQGPVETFSEGDIQITERYMKRWST